MALRKVPFVYTMTFAAIAANGAASGNVLIENDSDFFVERQRAVFWIDAASGTSIARTPLADRSDISPIASTGNAFYNHFQILATLKDNGSQWTKAATALPLLFDVGMTDRPFITPRQLGQGNTIYADITSYVGVAISGQLAFHGYKLLP